MNKSRNMVNNTQSKLFHYNELKYLFPSTPWNNFSATKIPDNYFQFNPHYFFYAVAIPNVFQSFLLTHYTISPSLSLYIKSCSRIVCISIAIKQQQNGLILINKFYFFLENVFLKVLCEFCSALCIAP